MEHAKRIMRKDPRYCLVEKRKLYNLKCFGIGRLVQNIPIYRTISFFLLGVVNSDRVVLVGDLLAKLFMTSIPLSQFHLLRVFL